MQVWPHKDMVTSADFSSRGQGHRRVETSRFGFRIEPAEIR